MIKKDIFSLEGKTILITGGYGHLGRSITVGLAEQGANVIVLGRNRTKFEKTFRVKGLPIKFLEFDIESTKSIRSGFKKIADERGRIDVLINNAYYLKAFKPLEVNDEDWSYGMDGILNSVYRCIREVSKYMIKSRQGRIINVASMYGFVSPDFSVYQGRESFISPPNYGAAKAGVIQLTRYFAAYLGKFNILVNSVSPGPFPSDKVQKDKKFLNNLKNKTILKRIGSPDELKGTFVFLSSEGSSFITGQNFIVDGGWTAW